MMMTAPEIRDALRKIREMYKSLSYSLYHDKEFSDKDNAMTQQLSEMLSYLERSFDTSSKLLFNTDPTFVMKEMRDATQLVKKFGEMRQQLVDEGTLKKEGDRIAIIDSAIEIMQTKRYMSDWSSAELSTVVNAMSLLDTINRRKVYMDLNGRKIKLSEISKRWQMAATEAVKNKRKALNNTVAGNMLENQLTPENFLRTNFGDEVGKEMYEELISNAHYGERIAGQILDSALGKVMFKESLSDDKHNKKNLHLWTSDGDVNYKTYAHRELNDMWKNMNSIRVGFDESTMSSLFPSQSHKGAEISIGDLISIISTLKTTRGRWEIAKNGMDLGNVNKITGDFTTDVFEGKYVIGRFESAQKIEEIKQVISNQMSLIHEKVLELNDIARREGKSKDSHVIYAKGGRVITAQFDVAEMNDKKLESMVKELDHHISVLDTYCKQVDKEIDGMVSTIENVLRNGDPEVEKFIGDCVEAMQEYFKEWGIEENKTSYAEDGVMMSDTTEAFYPEVFNTKEISKKYDSFDPDTQDTIRVRKVKEFLPAQKYSSTNNATLLCIPADMMVASYAASASRYVGVGKTVRAFNEVFQHSGSYMNYAGYEGNRVTSNFSDDKRTFINWFGDTNGINAQTYLINLMRDLNGDNRGDKSNLLTSVIRSGLVAGGLSFNARTELAQNASLWMASSILGDKYVRKAFMTSRKKMEASPMGKFMAYCAALDSRTSKDNVYESQALSAKLEKNKYTPRAVKLVNNLTQRGLRGITNQDFNTCEKLYGATEYWCDDNYAGSKFNENGEITEGYMEFFANKYLEVLEKTQPVQNSNASSILNKSEVRRSGNEILKCFTMFMSQRNQNFNLMYSARLDKVNATTAEEKKAANKRMRTTTRALLVSTIQIELMKMMVNMLLYHKPDDERDEETGDLSLDAAFDTLMRNTSKSLFGNVLGGSEVADMISAVVNDEYYYGMSINGLSSITDLASKTVAYAKAMKRIADLKADGIFTEEDRKTLLTAQDTAKRYLNRMLISTGTAIGVPYNQLHNLANGFSGWTYTLRTGDYNDFNNERTTTQAKNILWNGFSADDAAEIKRGLGYLNGMYSSDDGFKNAMYALALKELQSGEALEEDIVRFYQDVLEMEYEDASEKAHAQQYKADTGLNLSDAKNDYAEGKITREQFVETLEWKYKDKFDGDKLLEETLLKADYQKQTGFNYENLAQLYRDGKMSRSQVIEARMLIAGNDQQEAEQYARKQDFQIRYGISYNDMKDYYRAGLISADEAIEWRVYAGGASRNGAEQWVKAQEIYLLTGYEPTSTGSSSYYDTYRTYYDKKGSNTFFDDHIYEFSSFKAFGDVMMAIDEAAHTTYDENGYSIGTKQEGAAAQIKSLLSSGAISETLAREIWHEYLGYSKNTFNSKVK